MGLSKSSKGVRAIAYRLILHKRLKLHPIFNVSYLKLYDEDKEDPDKNK